MKTRQEEMAEQCQAFHDEHPEVWRLFVKFTHNVIEAGFKNYSANAIFERIRWEVDVNTPTVTSKRFASLPADRSGNINGGEPVPIPSKQPFKLNNNYRAYYARRFHKMYPQHDGFFRTREQTSKQDTATNLPELTRDYYE